MCTLFEQASSRWPIYDGEVVVAMLVEDEVAFSRNEEDEEGAPSNRDHGSCHVHKNIRLHFSFLPTILTMLP